MRIRKICRGFTLIELLVVIAIFFFLAVLSTKGLSSAVQHSKQSAAKAQIANMAIVLETIKEDTGLYPVCFLDTKETVAPPGIDRGWKGPYAECDIPLDPWGTAYFYQIPPTDIFLSPPLIRGTGSPRTDNITFEAVDGRLEGKIRIENYGVAAARILINGIQIMNESSFHVNPQPDIIERDITLQEGSNVLSCYIRAIPARYFIVYLSGYFPTKEYFILGSFGSDGMSGGTGSAQDFGWRSNIYPNHIVMESE